MQLRYLGIDTSSTHDPVKDLQSQINKALLGCLPDTVWSNSYKDRANLESTRPVSDQSRHEQDETHAIRVAEMKTLRTIVRKTRRDRTQILDGKYKIF